MQVETNIGNVNFSDRNNIISNNNIYDIGGLGTLLRWESI